MSTQTLKCIFHSLDGFILCIQGEYILTHTDTHIHYIPYTVVQPPVILAQPEDMLGVSTGEEVSFVVVTRGSRVSYLWEYRNGTALPNDLRYEGKNSSILTIFNVNPQDSGVFRCHVSNAAGSQYTELAQLNVGMIKKFEVTKRIHF